MRIAAATARFGAPIAKLGFPMAPREAALVMRAVGELTAREMLLSAAVFDAAEMKQRGFLSQMVPACRVHAAALERVARIIELAPQAARINKVCLRGLASALPAQQATDLTATAYDYADSAKHREGIAASWKNARPSFRKLGQRRLFFDGLTQTQNSPAPACRTEDGPSRRRGRNYRWNRNTVDVSEMSDHGKIQGGSSLLPNRVKV